MKKINNLGYIAIEMLLTLFIGTQHLLSQILRMLSNSLLRISHPAESLSAFTLMGQRLHIKMVMVKMFPHSLLMVLHICRSELLLMP